MGYFGGKEVGPAHQPSRVVERKVGSEFRYFVGMGWPGFNLPANNLNGYASAVAAMAASKRVQKQHDADYVAAHKSLKF